VLLITLISIFEILIKNTLVHFTIYSSIDHETLALIYAIKPYLPPGHTAAAIWLTTRDFKGFYLWNLCALPTLAESPCGKHAEDFYNVY